MRPLRFASLFFVSSLYALARDRLVFGASTEELACNGICPTHPMELSLKKFRSSVDALYSGQEDAISTISRELMKNMIENNNALTINTQEKQPRQRTKPLLLHFTGPTGVGKTLMASLIKEALFINDCGVRKIHLDVAYKYNTPDEQRVRIDNMKQSVIEQLERFEGVCR